MKTRTELTIPHGDIRPGDWITHADGRAIGQTWVVARRLDHDTVEIERPYATSPQPFRASHARLVTVLR